MYMRRNVRKRTFWDVRAAKTQISLRMRAVWLESSLSDRKKILRCMPREDSNQPAHARSLIRIFLVWQEENSEMYAQRRLKSACACAQSD